MKFRGKNARKGLRHLAKRLGASIVFHEYVFAGHYRCRIFSRLLAVRRESPVNLGEAEFPQGEFISPEDSNKSGPHESEDFVGHCNIGTL